MLSFFVDKPGNMSPFAFDRLNYFLLEFANRPISGILYYLVSSICGYNIFLVHIIILVLLILTIFSLKLFVTEFFKLLGIEEPEYYTILTLLFWISSPWILGITVWLSSALNIVSMIFFLLSSFFLLKSWNSGKNYYLIAILFYLLSCLTYESFFFQYVIIILIGLLLQIHKRLSKKAIIIPTILYTLATIAVIIWNRYSSLVFEKAIHKGTNTYWLPTFIANVISLPYSIFASVIEFSFILVPIFIILLFLLLKVLVSEKKKNNDEIKKILILLLIISSGIILSLLIYSGAGYTIWGIGSRSRTLIVPSIYFAMLFSIAIYIIKKYTNLKKKYLNVIIVLIILSLSLINILRSFEWHDAWNYQKEIISKLPVEELSKYDSTTTVIFDGPYRKNWISIIDASWAIDFQFKYGHIFTYNKSELEPITKVNFEVGRGMFHPILNKPYSLYWDGEKIITGYGLDSISLQNFKTKYYSKLDTLFCKKIIVWHYENNTLEYFEPPIKLSFEPFYNYDYWITWIWTNCLKKS
ncbi:MAG: hypothetical protein QXG00_08495 [Candidatus Woesearchaeota archaeon]